MARKKKSAMAAFLKKKKARRNPDAEPVKNAARKNPMLGEFTDLGLTIGTAAGAYAVNRTGANMIEKLVGNKLGFLTKHLTPLASLGLAALLWYVAEKWAWLRRYQNSVVVGSGIAVVHTLVQRYIPGLEVLLMGPSNSHKMLAASLAAAAAEDDGAIAEHAMIEETTNGSKVLTDPTQDLLTAITEDDAEDAELMTGVFARKQDNGIFS